MTAGDARVLRLKRILPAPRAAVYRALSDPGELAKWWGPRGFTTPSVEFDPRVGGGYRIAMQPPDGELFHLSGEFREVEPPARLAYTFRWNPPDPDDRQTVVVLSLQDWGERTEVLLAQREFATEERLAIHEGGWIDSFGRLEQLLSAYEEQSVPLAPSRLTRHLRPVTRPTPNLGGGARVAQAAREEDPTKTHNDPGGLKNECSYRHDPQWRGYQQAVRDAGSDQCAAGAREVPVPRQQ